MLEQEFYDVMNALLPQTSSCQKVAVAVSGGSDSMALVLLTQAWCQESGRECIALTVDHGLREESQQEARQVAGWLQKYGISHHTLTWEGKKPESNIQSLARQARYRLLTAYCKEHGIPAILLGHHKKDQAETLLMRMLRGSGLKGLSGMKAKRDQQGLLFLRPLLGMTKNQLQSYLKKQEQYWVEDPSNENVAYDRVWIRNLLQSHRDADLLSDRLYETSLRLQQTDSFVNAQLYSLWKDIIHVDEKGFVSFDLEWFKTAHAEVQYQTIQRALYTVTGLSEPYRYDAITGAICAIMDGKLRHTLYHTMWEVKKGKVYCFREPDKMAKPVVSSGKEIYWDGRWEVAPLAAGYTIGAITKEGFDQFDIKLPVKRTRNAS